MLRERRPVLARRIDDQYARRGDRLSPQIERRQRRVERDLEAGRWLPAPVRFRSSRRRPSSCDELPHDRQPEAGAAVLARGAADRPARRARKMCACCLGRNADAGVAAPRTCRRKRMLVALGCTFAAHIGHSPSCGELDGIARPGSRSTCFRRTGSPMSMRSDTSRSIRRCSVEPLAPRAPRRTVSMHLSTVVVRG